MEFVQHTAWLPRSLRAYLKSSPLESQPSRRSYLWLQDLKNSAQTTGRKHSHPLGFFSRINQKKMQNIVEVLRYLLQYPKEYGDLVKWTESATYFIYNTGK